MHWEQATACASSEDPDPPADATLDACGAPVPPTVCEGEPLEQPAKATPEATMAIADRCGRSRIRRCDIARAPEWALPKRHRLRQIWMCRNICLQSTWARVAGPYAIFDVPAIRAAGDASWEVAKRCGSPRRADHAAAPRAMDARLDEHPLRNVAPDPTRAMGCETFIGRQRFRGGHEALPTGWPPDDEGRSRRRGVPRSAPTRGSAGDRGGAETWIRGDA